MEEFVGYYANGQKQSEGIFYWDGESWRHGGKWKKWFKNNVVELEGNFDRGYKDGSWKFYWENGKLRSDREYKKGKRVGVWKTYYKNGKLRSMHGELNCMEWHMNGRIMTIGQFANKRREGKWTLWYDNGQKHIQGVYKDDQQAGIWESWFENGDRRALEFFRDGCRFAYKEWDRKGEVIENYVCWEFLSRNEIESLHKLQKRIRQKVVVLRFRKYLPIVQSIWYSPGCKGFQKARKSFYKNI
uniref:Uncharacterized protein n=1 Tax=viral metagenome TaxID=1070528 RepID=A0A6C0EQ99_9ZZZZ